MKQKSFEQLLKEEIRVDRLTPLQFSGILRAHAKYEIQSEQLRKHSVMQAEGSAISEGAAVGNGAKGTVAERGFYCWELDSKNELCKEQCIDCKTNIV